MFGATTLSNALTVSGAYATNLGGALTVTGDATLNNPTTINDTLTVTGTSTLRTTNLGGSASGRFPVSVFGATTLSNALTVSGAYATNLGGALTVTGTTTLNGLVNIGTQQTSLDGALSVAGTTSFTGAVNIGTLQTSLGGALSVAGTASFTGAVNIGTLQTSLNGSLLVKGVVNIQNQLNVVGAYATSLDGSLSVDGAVFVGGQTRMYNTLTMETTNTQFGLTAKCNAASFVGDVLSLVASRAVTGNPYNFMKCIAGPTADNKLRIAATGNVHTAGQFLTTGADYAEYFEWSDGNPDGMDRRGMTVYLESNKICLATANTPTSDIIGVVSCAPAIAGDSAFGHWASKYLVDEFGAQIVRPVEMIEVPTTDGGTALYLPDKVPPDANIANAITVEQLMPIQNPDWDESKEYLSRDMRKEWAPVGLVGKLRVRAGQPLGDRWIKLAQLSPTMNYYLVR